MWGLPRARDGNKDLGVVGLVVGIAGAMDFFLTELVLESRDTRNLRSCGLGRGLRAAFTVLTWLCLNS